MGAQGLVQHSPPFGLYGSGHKEECKEQALLEMDLSLVDSEVGDTETYSTRHSSVDLY